MPIQIIRDDREKKPWDEKYLGSNFTCSVTRLNVGDYTIKGMEDIVRFEKKENWEELAINVGGTTNRNNFIKELRALSEFPIRALIINDSIKNLDKPYFRFAKVTTPAIVRLWLLNITLEYGIPVYQVGRGIQARMLVREIFTKAHDLHKSGRAYYAGSRKR